MKKRCWLNEDKLPPTIEVRFSSRIAQEIRRINLLNKHNINALNNWKEYLCGIKRYLSDSNYCLGQYG